MSLPKSSNGQITSFAKSSTDELGGCVSFQILTFTVIGVANTLVHGAMLVWLMESWQWPVWAAHLLAFFVAYSFSYMVNSRWTFHATISLVQYVRFVLSSLLALALTLAISQSAQLYGLNYREGFVLVIVFVPAFSFLLMKFWAFRR